MPPTAFDLGSLPLARGASCSAWSSFAILRTADAERTVRALLERELRVEGLEVTAPRLEDAFLALTREEESR